METTTIPASITIPTETFDWFADRLGYQPEIEDPKDESKMIANPESKVEFAQRIFKSDVVMPWVLQFANMDIDVAVNDKREEERKAAKEAAYKALEPAVTVG